MMHFHEPKSSHSYQGKDQEVYGCFTRTDHSTDLFLKRNYHIMSHEELCYQAHVNSHQNYQTFHYSHSTNSKMSLRKINTKTFNKTPELYNNSQKLIPRRKKQDNIYLCQNGSICLCNNKTAKLIEKRPNSDFPADNEIYRRLQVVQKKAVQLHNPEFHFNPPQTVHQLTFAKPKIHFQIESPKIGHQRCKSQNHRLQTNAQHSDRQIDSASKNFMNAIFRQNQNLQNKNYSNISTINQNSQKIFTSKLSLQTNLSSDGSKKSLVHLPEHNVAQDPIISNKSSAILNNTAHSLHSFISNSKKLKKIDEVLQVQSLGDENEVQSDCESIVLGKEDEQSLVLQEEAKGGQTWRLTQKRLSKVSKLLKSQSVDIL